MSHRGGVHRIELSIEVATLAAAPLPSVLDGNAVVLAQTMALEFGPQIHHSESCYAYY
jgi:hypothetical protein